MLIALISPPLVALVLSVGVGVPLLGATLEIRARRERRRRRMEP